jgi:hypothetical protein
MEHKQKCLHATCACPALPLQDYCCDGCKAAVEREEAGETPIGECHCHHADCGGEVEIPVETQSLFMASEVLAAA